MVTFYSQNKWVGIITSVLLIANIITLTLLWSGNRQTGNESPLPHTPGGGAAFEFVVKELGLNEQQQNAYKLLRDEHQQQMKPLADSVAILKNSYFALLKDTTVTDNKLVEYGAKTMQYQQQIDLVTFKHFQKLRLLCTNEQKQKFDTIIQDVLRRLSHQRPALRNSPPPHHTGEREEDGPPPPQQ